MNHVFEALDSYSTDISKIHEVSFAEPWNDAVFLEYMNKSTTRFYVARLKGQIIGFILIEAVDNEGEILTLATHPDHRQNGVARGLLGHVLDILSQQGFERLLLEVAFDNQAALSLYQGLGFEPCGIRKAYYHRPNSTPIDAHVLNYVF